MPTRPIGPNDVLRVPLEYAGQWVVWTADHSKIVTSGNSFEEACENAERLGIVKPVFEKIPRPNIRFVGKI